MTPQAQASLDELRGKLRSASIATLGVFRPPEDPLSSWFGKAVARADEGLPMWQGAPMFPLLQIRVSELPYVPAALQGVALLVLFHNLREHPFDQPNGEGWLIREYASLEGLVPLPAMQQPCKAFPLRWSRVDDDAPGWEDAWDVVALDAVNEDEEASDEFFEAFERYACTKVGGYPKEIQHGVGLADYVFQVGSEEKADWMWADNGIGYFFRSPTGEWRWSCQFY